MNRIKLLRVERGMKQAELAKLINVSAAALSGYETGKYEAPVETYKFLADYFGVSLDYLLGNTDDPAENKKPAPVSGSGQSDLAAMLDGIFSQLSPDGQLDLVIAARAKLREEQAERDGVR